MEKFFEVLIAIVKPPWNYVSGVIALLIVVVPRLMVLSRDLVDARMGRRKLELEKLQLEVLKLRMDMQQLAKQQSPEVARELEASTVAPPSVATPPPPAPEHRAGLRGLLARHPRFGRLVMLTVQAFLVYLTITFAVLIVAIPVMGWNDPEFGPVVSIVLAVIYAALMWLSYKGFVVDRSIRKELAAR